MHDVSLLTTIAVGFAAAWALGLITQALKLSPIVGYMLAGIAIGPHTPGFVGDIAIANQLAEVGVILLMFGVGLHFRLQDLLAVKRIAIPGAVGQSLVATLFAIGIFALFDWPMKGRFVIGMAMAVASTVVLLRVLMDRRMLDTVHGHVAVGWLIVEDIFTVLMLVLLPMMATNAGGADGSIVATTSPVTEHSGWLSVGIAVLKLAALVAIVLLAGSRVVPWILVQVAKLRSRELFTLTVLVVSVGIAVGAAALFDTSVALGAFLAGMVVGRSPVSHEAAADALPMRDAFAVLFFVAVGMVFDPAFLLERPWMVGAGLAIVLLIKPISALGIVLLLGYSTRTALTVAIGLAQIGEFSFILSEVARDYHLMPEDGHHVLTATAIISIAINPLLFRSLDSIERWLEKRPRLWRILNLRANRKVNTLNTAAARKIAEVEKPLAIIVGYGPVGRVVDALLRDSGMETSIVELNADTVQMLSRAGRLAVYGDASRTEILKQAGATRAVHLLITLPHPANPEPMVLAAREANPAIEVTVRTRYLGERESLSRAGASKTIAEEGEAGIAMARHVMQRRGLENASIERMLSSLRRLWRLDE